MPIDKGLSVQPKAPRDPEIIADATAWIARKVASGDLRPIDGWDGDPVEGYLDLLGLNDRPMRSGRKT